MLFLFLTGKSGHYGSSLGIVVLRCLLEAGPTGPGLRWAGAVFGRRTLGREGRHRGLNKGAAEAARAPRGAAGAEGALRRAPAVGPRPFGLGRGGREAPNWAMGGWLPRSCLVDSGGCLYSAVARVSPRPEPRYWDLEPWSRHLPFAFRRGRGAPSAEHGLRRARPTTF